MCSLPGVANCKKKQHCSVDTVLYWLTKGIQAVLEALNHGECSAGQQRGYLHHLTLGSLAPSKGTGVISRKLLVQGELQCLCKDHHQLDKGPGFLIWVVQIIPFICFSC